MIKRIVLPVIILVTAIAIFMMLKLSKTEAPKVDKPEKVWLVKAVKAKLETRRPDITIYGRVETPRNATLSSALQAEVVGESMERG